MAEQESWTDATADVSPEGRIVVTFPGFDPERIELTPQQAWAAVRTLYAQGWPRAAEQLKGAVLKAYGARGSA
jgi:hypothetical protein